jgi:hypothetical protein
MIGVSLEAAPPGEYELVMRIKDEFSGDSTELREPFHVSPQIEAGRTGAGGGPGGSTPAS